MLDMVGTTGHEGPRVDQKGKGRKLTGPLSHLPQTTGPLCMLPRHYGLDGLEP